MDKSWFLGGYNRKYGLANFDLPVKVVNDTSRMPLAVAAFKARIARKFCSRRFGLPVYKEPHFHYDPAFELINTPVVLDGYFQSDRYFSAHELQIRKDLEFNGVYPEKSKPIREKIDLCDAIAIHIRRGDYLSSRKNVAIYRSLPLQYYTEAVKTLSADLKSPRCFVFSDDILWVKNHLQLNIPIELVDVNLGDEAYWDLRLMSSCRNFVIANSSLSWWGAWLAEDPLKKVVAPKQWFNGKSIITSDLIPKSWIQF